MHSDKERMRAKFLQEHPDSGLSLSRFRSKYFPRGWRRLQDDDATHFICIPCDAIYEKEYLGTGEIAKCGWCTGERVNTFVNWENWCAIEADKQKKEEWAAFGVTQKKVTGRRYFTNNERHLD